MLDVTEIRKYSALLRDCTDDQLRGLYFHETARGGDGYYYAQVAIVVAEQRGIDLDGRDATKSTFDINEIDAETAERVGKALAEFLHLKRNKAGRFETSYGDKAERGLAVSVLRVIVDAIKK
jgi:hypothetical protein